ncbi:NADP-dependent oxidoreductase domain-containing protein [Immersiella caudata]|uniref:NADP-dependent oxidoreductase domain-containing protein n=1 Tax=Immersiella caudata TaxID=314043 RepID=A0AA39WDB0_9PEZI|nr:NADP-dependent oxidoreductase domain-containing protein [Immersiella caudata]
MDPNTPLLVYGTAWKKGKTAELTGTAVRSVFAAVDTANYPTACSEPLTGNGIAVALKSGIKRSDLFIQIKFTRVWAHERDKIPFNPDQSIKGQIKESIQQSLEHLHVDYLDALLLHIPFAEDSDNLVGWKVFESFVPLNIRALSVSSFSLAQLEDLYANATIKPSIIQNCFYRETGFDIDLREFCKERGITYHAYWMIKHIPEASTSKLLASVAKKLKVEKELAFYILVVGLGGTQVLDGSAKPERMLRGLKAVNEVFGSRAVLYELQPEIEKFRQLLLELAV